MIDISIEGKTYKVKEAKLESELKQGLKGIKKLPENEGMLFYFDPPREISMTMQDTLIALDQVFINDDQEVIKVVTREPKDENLVTVSDVAYVLEVNADSRIKEGDELEFKDDESAPVMKVLFPDGSEQMSLWGGERIFSRIQTKTLIKKAKKAELTQDDKDFKALGRYMFKCIKGQDTRPAEYIEVK